MAHAGLNIDNYDDTLRGLRKAEDSCASESGAERGRGKRKKKRKNYDDEGEMPLPQPPQTMLKRSTNVLDLAEARAATIQDEYEVQATVPQLPASTSVSTAQQRAASGSVLAQDLSASPTSGIIPGPSKRHEDLHLQFFEKRLQLEQGAKGRDTELEKERLALEREGLAVEDGRITLEHDRLALDKEVFLQKKREWEDTQDEKRGKRLARQRERQHERDLYLRQQDALIDLGHWAIPCAIRTPALQPPARKRGVRDWNSTKVSPTRKFGSVLLLFRSFTPRLRAACVLPRAVRVCG
ncbi:hypothetical protein HPB52_024329 [Rhipicephalus sanguineus]|uniref:Uncharacterized protein n=1 Tax=Rhipicephalus sanguineus TaxID=34632 RepID=A0A9D4TCF8_RHISA|nr:hypothetical protein HPB52_024329 [Rhipicephalus sanguineus]